MARTLPEDHQPYPLTTSDDLIACWRCDELAATDTLVDAGPGGYDLVDEGSPGVAGSLFEDGDGTFGARTFNGVDQWAASAGSPGIDAEMLGAVTVMAWAAPDAAWAADGIAFEYGSFTTNAMLRVGLKSDLRMWAAWEHGAGVREDAITAAAHVAAGERHHFAWARERDPTIHNRWRVRFYVDGDLIETVGNLEGTEALPGGKLIVGGSLDLGTLSTPGALWKGALDDVVVLPFAATHEHVRATHARGVRDFSMAQLAGSDSFILETHVRVLVQDRNDVVEGVRKVWGEYVDLSDIFGADLLQSAEWSEGIDDVGATATLTLSPQTYAANLSPFARAVSGVGAFSEYKNPLARDTAGRYFLDAFCAVKIEVAILPQGMGRANAGPFWDLAFDGYVQSADVSSGSVTVACIDKIAALQRVFIETDGPQGTERAYGQGVTADPSLEGVVRQIIADNNPARFTILSIDDSEAGGALFITLFRDDVVNGAGRPHGFIAGDSLLVSGTANYDGVWTVAEAFTNGVRTVEASGGSFAAETTGFLLALPALSYFGGGVPEVWVPTPSGFTIIKQNLAATKNVAQASDDIAAEISWRVAYLWDENRTEFRLAVHNPRLLNGVVIMMNTDVLEYGRFATRIDDQRPAGVVEYARSDTPLDPTGARKRYIVGAVDAAQMRQYGRNVFRVGRDGASLINTPAEAQAVVDQIVADLASPTAEADVTFKLSPQFAVGDRLSLTTGNNDRQLPTVVALLSTKATIVGVTHRCADTMTTTVHLRKIEDTLFYSQRVGRVAKHFDIIQQSGVVGGDGLAPVAEETPPTVAYAGIYGVVQVSWPAPVGEGNRAWDTTEVHVSTSGASFTPSSSTLKALVRGTSILVPNQGPGSTIYVRLAHRDTMGNRKTTNATTFVVP